MLELRYGLDGKQPRTLDEVGRDVQRHARADPADREPEPEEAPRAVGLAELVPARRTPRRLRRRDDGAGSKSSYRAASASRASSADPSHADDVRRAGEWVRDFIRGAGGEAELVDDEPPAARDRRAARVPRRGRARRPCSSTATSTCSRPRRSTSGTAHPFEPEIRDELGLRARDRRRQGAALLAPAGGRGPRRRGRAAGQRPHRLRRRGGDRRRLDRRLGRCATSAAPTSA